MLVDRKPSAILGAVCGETGPNGRIVIQAAVPAQYTRPTGTSAWEIVARNKGSKWAKSAHFGGKDVSLNCGQ